MEQKFEFTKKTRNTRETNDLTEQIINGLFRIGVFAHRDNVLPIPVSKGGAVVGYRPPAIAGVPDIRSYVRAGLSSRWPKGGGSLLFELKAWKGDRLRDTQIGYHADARACGAVILVIKTYEDFLAQIKNVFDLISDEDFKKLNICE